MKKYWIYYIASVITVMASIASCNKDDDDVSYEQLPDQSKSLIETYFAGIPVTSVDKAKGDGMPYEVVLNDGTEIEFQADGNWREIDGKSQSLPRDILNILPSGIADYLATHYTGFSIVKIELEDSGYELTLNDNTELRFSSNGQFVRIDNAGTGVPDNSGNSVNSGSYESLPQAARTFLETQLAGVKVTRVEYKSGDSTPYEVHLEGGVEIEFDANGNWKEINGKNKAIPANITAFLPSKMMNYIASNYAGKSIVKIENEGSKFEVELSSGLKLKFSPTGEFLRSDD